MEMANIVIYVSEKMAKSLREKKSLNQAFEQNTKGITVCISNDWERGM